MDAGAPELWLSFLNHPDPEDFYAHLGADDRRIIDYWRDHRSPRVQALLQQEIDAKLEDFEDDFVLTTPYVRILVRSLIDTPGAKADSSELGMLTIWNPSEEQLEVVREGNAIRIKNLGVGSHSFEGLQQFTANGQTPISRVSPHDGVSCHESPTTSVTRIHLMSRNQAAASTELETSDFDVVILMLQLCQSPDVPGWVLLGTDPSGLPLRVECDIDRDVFAFLSPMSPWARDNLETCLVGRFRHVRLRPFDVESGCAVVQFKETSSFALAPHTPRGQALVMSLISDRGRRRLDQLAARFDARIPSHLSDSGTAVTVGHIHRFVFLRNELLLVDVDCSGMDEIQTYKFPLSLLPSFIDDCAAAAANGQDPPCVVLNEEEEGRLASLTNMGSAFRCRHQLLRFRIQRLCSTLSSVPLCEYEVLDVSRVDTEAMAAWYMNASK